MRSSLAVAAAALALFSAPLASAAEAPVDTSAETTATESTESTGFTFYKSFAGEFTDHFRCSNNPQLWWCGG
ncbi:hypothetical protein GCM10009604_06660 [Corynebacterium aurimucosum]|uniref:hypothetical protein n=1 Tax=Corynebacterium aurimucosum TaxID=169292 RepID=UPI00191D456D|nr:hypothetical protein [Corynebacterium aurimucosum]QQU96055.1 hypothetical protein I6I66_02790 [Corynebacterium aurimucosum]UTA71053.1 hypothetical protein J3S22_09895 [Corynebacterium aurimucosum]WJY69194.1 hypothetical protein CAURIM_00165 [Corynebacterium aurimucosum]